MTYELKCTLPACILYPKSIASASEPRRASGTQWSMSQFSRYPTVYSRKKSASLIVGTSRVGLLGVSLSSLSAMSMGSTVPHWKSGSVIRVVCLASSSLLLSGLVVVDGVARVVDFLLFPTPLVRAMAGLSWKPVGTCLCSFGA